MGLPTDAATTRDDLARITLPTLAIHGDSGATVPVEVSGRRMADSVSDAKLVVIKGGAAEGGHGGLPGSEVWRCLRRQEPRRHVTSRLAPDRGSEQLWLSTMRVGRSWCEHGQMARRVLLVDDHEAFRSAARALLQAEGFDVVADTGTGAEAVSLARTLRPDVVLLDVRLPDVDGIAVAGDLAALSPRPVVVLVSSRAAAVYGERLRTAPVHGFLAKSRLTGEGLREVLEGQP